MVMLFGVASPCFSQNNGSNPNDALPPVPLYNGIRVGLDLYGLGSKALGGDFLSTEVSVEANLKNRFFPIAEIGFGTTDTWSETGIHYKSSAPYFRIGMNYNTMYKKNNSGYLYVGLRYGFSTFSYDVRSMSIEDPDFGGFIGNPGLKDEYWGIYTPGFDHSLSGSMHWAEFLVGVNVHIYKNIHMGWTFRMKYRISVSAGKYGDPWYVPGFGKYDSSSIGLGYSIIYKLPF